MKYASIDIGSNTVLLLIASYNSQGEIKPLVEKAEITRLGEKLDTSGTLLPEAMDRNLAVLRQFTELCHRNEVSRISCVGTEALRRAKNSQEFVQKVEEVCGFRVEVIPGKKEAELAYVSALSDFGTVYTNLVVVDIGGGSTEVIWQKELKGNIARLQAVSIKMGSVRLTENHFKNDPPTAEEFENLKQAIQEKIDQELGALVLPNSPVTLIGLAGTLTTLSAMDQKLAVYDPQKIQGATLKRESLERLIEEMRNKNLEERKNIIGMEPKRADVLLAGALLLEALMKKFNARYVVVSDHGIRYGLFYQRFVVEDGKN